MNISRSSVRPATVTLATVAFLGVGTGTALWSARAPVTSEAGQLASLASPAPARAFPTEQAWIVADVGNAIVQMAQYRGAGTGARVALKMDVQAHLWSPATFLPLASSLFGTVAPATPDVDLDARTPLTRLTVDVLLEQNERLSAILGRDMRSPAAHESAALLVAAHALREPPGMFADVRPALSRMSAHLAVAQALRGGGTQTLDGALAHAVLTTLVGRQRDALSQLVAIEQRARTTADRAWIRALRLRNTGDWRIPVNATATLLERFEYARAVRTRSGSDRLAAFLDSFEADASQTDWHRIALTDGFNLEMGARFTDDVADRELAEAGHVWSTMRGRAPTTDELIAALNTRPENGPVVRVDGADKVTIVGWGAWAAFEQRQLAHGLTALSRHLYNRSVPAEQAALVGEIKARYSSLTLYPIVLRWVALASTDYETGMTAARRLAATTPQVITATAWNFLAEKPSFVPAASSFPFVQTWFEPAVPQGTAFDLYARALLPGCPRPPTARQARLWADEVPYDHWVQWSAEWLAVTGKPSLVAVRRSLGDLLAYDYGASLKLIEHMAMSTSDRIDVARQLCTITTGRCYMVADLLLRDGREAEAVVELERWIASSRSDVAVANQVTWLVRHYFRTGRVARAEEVASNAATSFSYTGLEAYAHLLDAQGKYDEAEKIYKTIAERYDSTSALGAFTIRQAMRKKDRVLELAGWDLLRRDFPHGLQLVEMHALETPPRDGIVFSTFGKRAAAVGLHETDVVVGVDEWRVRNNRQFATITRLRHDEAMTFVVWRGGRYQQIRARVPERWLGLELADYRGERPAN